MLWTSIVSYFTDSPRMHGDIYLMILKESIDNQKVTCIDDKEANVARHINEICKKQLLFTYTHESISSKYGINIFKVCVWISPNSYIRHCRNISSPISNSFFLIS